jgi:predicted short-subunit dehydrogenase-like oxidoreductase (DUF2520 family)
MKIGIIGAGRVGCSIGKYLVEADTGVTLTGYFSREFHHAKEAADFTGTTAYKKPEEIIKASDTLFLTVADDAIKEVWDYIARQNLTEKLICHFSGSLSSDVFSGVEQTGASVGSIHPMYAFSDRFHSYEKLHTALFTMEGDDLFLKVMVPIFEGLGNTVITIKKEDKLRYHAAASLASNHMLGLLSMSIHMLTEAGFSKEAAYALLKPLMTNNLNKAFCEGAASALTGPIERGDAGTVKKHLEVLKPEEKSVYQSLGRQVLALAREKHPLEQEKYKEIEEILRWEKIQ